MKAHECGPFSGLEGHGASCAAHVHSLTRGLSSSRRAATLQPGDPAALHQHGVAGAERAQQAASRSRHRARRRSRRVHRDHPDAELLGPLGHPAVLGPASAPSSAIGPSTAVRRSAGRSSRASSAAAIDVGLAL